MGLGNVTWNAFETITSKKGRDIGGKIKDMKGPKL